MIYAQIKCSVAYLIILPCTTSEASPAIYPNCLVHSSVCESVMLWLSMYKTIANAQPLHFEPHIYWMHTEHQYFRTFIANLLCREPICLFLNFNFSENLPFLLGLSITAGKYYDIIMS